MPDLTADVAAISGEARKVPCGHCAAEPLEDCWPGRGIHVLRLAAAYRQGLVSEPDMRAVLGALVVLTPSRVVPEGLAAA